MKSMDRKLLLLVATYGMVLMAGLNTGWVGPLIPSIAKIQGVPMEHLGLLFSMQFFGCITTLLTAARVIDFAGVRKTLMLAALFTLMGCLSMSMKTDIIFVWLGALLLGCGAGFNTIAGTIVVLRLAKTNTATALNTMHLFFGLGALIGPIIAWAAHKSAWSYSAAYFVGCAISTILMSMVAYSSELPKRETTRKTPESITTLKSFALWLFSFTMFFYVGIETGAAAWLFVYLKKASLLPHFQASLGMSSLWLGLTLGRIWGGSLCNRFSAEVVTLSFMILSMLSLLLLTLVPNMSVFTLGVILLLGLGFGPVFPTIVALVTQRYSHAEALVTTVAISTGFAGGMIFPWVAGFVFHDSGMKEGMCFILAGAIVMISLFLVALKTRESSPNPEETVEEGMKECLK